MSTVDGWPGRRGLGWGVVKSPGFEGAGPVGLIHTQKFQFFWTKNPLGWSKLKRTTYRHKARNEIFVDANFFGHTGKAGKAQIFTRVPE